MENATIHQPHDKFFKASMSELRVARDFFECYLPRHILEHINLATLELQKNTFIDEHYKKTEADVIYQTEFDGQPGYLYLLCEEQTEPDPDIAFRLLRYMVNIMRAHRKKHPHEPLPIVYPFVFYIGHKPYDAPTDIFALFGDNQALARQIIFQPYQLIDVNHIPDEQLRTHLWAGVMSYMMKYRLVRDVDTFWQQVFSWLHEIEQANGSDYVKIVIKYAVNGLDAKEEKVFIQQARQHLSEQLGGEIMTLAECFEKKGYDKGMQEGMTIAKQFEKKGYDKGMQESMTIAKRFEKKGYDKGVQQGVQQGMQHGMQQARIDVARNLRQLGLSAEDIEKATGICIDELNEV